LGERRLGIPVALGQGFELEVTLFPVDCIEKEHECLVAAAAQLTRGDAV